MNHDPSNGPTGEAAAFFRKLAAATGRNPLIPSGPRRTHIRYRCAKSGKRFEVVFTQESPHHRHQITEVIASPAAGDQKLPSSDGLPGPASFGRELASAELDFGGWYCPHCGHGKPGPVETLFVHCGKCREYVCGGRCRKVQDKTLFACHDGCGCTGAMEGNIKTYDAVSPDPMGLLGGATDHRRLGGSAADRALPGRGGS